jgi:hypothetical protein
MLRRKSRAIRAGIRIKTVLVAELRVLGHEIVEFGAQELTPAARARYPV